MQPQESPASDASNLPSAQGQQSDTNQAGATAEAPRKRLKRRPIACTECRRRKAKCNRQTPCSECIKRGEANLCNGAHCETDDILPFWPAGARAINIPAAQYLPANAADVDDLARRVIAIEKRLAMQPTLGADTFGPTEARGFPSPASSADQRYAGLPQSENDSNPDDGLEAAVKSLESVALEYFGEPASLPSPDHAIGPNVANTEYNAARGTIWLASGPSRISIAMKLVQGNNPLHSIVQALPRRETCRKILQAFHDYADEGMHYVHRPSFTTQCEQFLNLSSPGDVERLDPAWLALFTNALAHGAKALHLRDPSYDSSVPLHVKLHAATQLALAQAEWTSRPQARVIQTLIGMACLLSHTGSIFFADPTDRDLGGGEHCRTLLGTAVSLARRLGLHRLDNNAKPSDCPFLLDASFAFVGPSSLHTELGRRLWWSLVTLDAKSSIGRESERHIPSNSFSTPLPSRTLDESLGPSPHATLVPKGYFSDADTIVYQARLIEFLDCVPKSKLPSYTDIMTLDGLWRTRFQELLGLDMGDTGWISTQPYLHNSMQTTLIGALHARLLRLHRPYFLKGLRIVQYERSYKTCLQCAQAILTVLASPVVAETNVYQWWAYQHAINAAIVIVLAHLHRVSTRGHQAYTDEGLEQAIRPARELFRKGEASLNKAVSATGRQCRQLLELLCSIEPKQTTTASSPDILVSALGQAAQSLHHVSPHYPSDSVTTKEGHNSSIPGIIPPAHTSYDYNRLAESAMLVSNAPVSRQQPTESLAALSQELMHYLGSDTWKADVPSTAMSSLFDLPSMGLDSSYLGQESLGADYSWLFQSPNSEAAPPQ